MSSERRGWAVSKPFSKGHLNHVIDAALHPFFDENKAFILIDGLAHGLVEKNARLSIRKFIKYNFPTLMMQKKGQSKMPRARRRSYSCMIPVGNRYNCGHKRAGPSCLGLGAGRAKCPRLIISYERTL